MTDSIFDVCIIGGGFSGLLAAKTLSKKGLNVALIESRDALGGEFRPSQSQLGPISRDFGYLPATENAKHCLDTLIETGILSATATEETLPALTYNKGQLQPFVGFGEFAPAYVDELNYYLRDSRFIIEPTISTLTQQLIETHGATICLGAHVKQWEFRENSISGLRLDDNTLIKAKTFVYTDQNKFLLKTLPTEHYTQRELHKLVKTPRWSSVSLDLVHGTPICETQAVHVLMGTTKESPACIGGFEKTKTQNGVHFQASHWMCFVPTDNEDQEIPANALRELKRQLKRVYTNAFENLKFEKITLNPNYTDIPLQTDAQGRWPNTENLWISNSDVNREQGLVGAMSQSLLVTTAVLQYFQKKAESSQPVEASL